MDSSPSQTIENIDRDVVAGFGDEWSRFDQTEMSSDELRSYFDGYFSHFPWHALPKNAVGFDLGCGSGRWATLVAPRVGLLHLIDPSDAIDVARRNLASFSNCVFHRASVDEIPLVDESADFAYCLGVLHHIPDTLAGMKAAVKKLKPGAPFLVYLYYRFDNRPWWFRMVWRSTDVIRRFISIMPNALRYFLSQILAIIIYWPLAHTAKLVERLGMNVTNLPLSQYRNSSFYRMRTDALDRFGTRLEQRFTRVEVETMMLESGLEDIKFADDFFWTAIGTKK